MLIAIPYDNGRISQHFGHAAQIKLYQTAGGSIANSLVMNMEEGGHDALVDFLASQGVNAVICGGIGGGARVALDKAGIILYPGVVGDADSAALGLLEGTLLYNRDTVCAGHEHGGHCGCHCHCDHHH